jgi:hypothetical protein
MPFQKYASIDAATMVMVPRGTLAKWAHRHDFQYKARPGFIYVRSRAISSRTNDNFDTFPAEELREAWATFIGKPVFVNHHNDDHTRMRGVIIDAALHDDKAPDGTEDAWVEVLMEVDALRFPKLAAALIKKDIERTSMGTDVVESECSFCGNVARVPDDYCAHVRRMKGQRLRRKNPETGEVEDVLVHEICRGLSFFENSLLVEDPADPTAFTFGLDTSGLAGIVDEDPADGDIDRALATAARLARTASFKVASHDDLIDRYLNAIPSGDAALIRRMGVPKTEERPVGSGPSFAWYESGTNTICFTTGSVPFDLVAHEMTHVLDCAAGWPSETPEYKSLIPKSLKDSYRNVARAGHSVVKEVFVDAYMAAHFPGKQSTHFEAAKSSDPERTNGLLEIARNVASVRTAAFKPKTALKAARGLSCSIPEMGRESLAMARRMSKGTATAQDIVRCCTTSYGGVGEQWGLEGSEYGSDWADNGAEDYAFVNDDTVVKAWVEEQVDGGWSASDDAIWEELGDNLGEIAVILIGDTNAHYVNNGWDAAIGRGARVNLTEVRYNAGWGWKRLPASGLSVVAARGGPYNPAEESRDGFLWRATPGEKVCGGKYEVKRHWDAARMTWLAFDVDSSGEQYNIGYIVIERTGGRLVVDEVKVDDGYRREGLAAAMLRIAERELGSIEHADVDSLTPDGLQWARKMQGKPVSQDDQPGAMWNPLTAAVALDEAQRARFKGVSVDKDKEGYYVRTHRARSDSYESIEAIPDSAIEFIESTGSKVASEPITCHGVCAHCHERKQLVGHGLLCQECQDSLTKKGWRMATIKTAVDIGLPAQGRVPVQVETLRPQTCPVCESDGVWNSDGRCDVCGYLPPPKPFRAPDTDVAGRADQSGGWFDPDLTRATPFKLEGSNPVKQPLKARKGQKAPEGAHHMAQNQISVAAAARSRVAAQSLAAENERLRAQLRRRADAENPAQPVQEPAPAAPSQSSDQAMSLPTSTQVTTPGGVIPDPISAPGSVTTPGGEIADPIGSYPSANLEVPVAGTTEPDPAAVIDVQPDASGETIGENAFGGDFLLPDGGTVPDLPGNAATARRRQAELAGRIASAVRDRIFASLRLAQMQISAGLVQGDLIEEARKIEGSKDTMDVIRARTATLNQVAARPRVAAPTPRIAARQAPSLASGSLPHFTGALQPRDGDEALFE